MKSEATLRKENDEYRFIIDQIRTWLDMRKNGAMSASQTVKMIGQLIDAHVEIKPREEV